jgi:alginate O-acetyltransferase complex protein AlgI
VLFTSLWYWLFFAVVATLYFTLPHRMSLFVLAGAGFIFYGSWDPRFVPLLAGSALFNFLTGIAIAQAEAVGGRRVWLAIAVIGNLVILSIFKYYDFFAASISSFIGLDPQSVLLHIVLPIGISFYTFEGIAYNIDVYRRDLDPQRDLVDFSLFTTFFPHLVAGPIIRPMYFFPQIKRANFPLPEDLRWGSLQIVKGLLKKTILADNFAIFADSYFNGLPGWSGTLPALIGLVSFSMQIYFDFSGYTDIARGCAKLLGYDFPPNFERPYLSSNIAEFWRRWHISLSTWLREYLYIPLGGNRSGTGRTYVNLLLVMTLGGLWHGANWNFLVWGGYHGALLALHRVYRSALKKTRFEPVTQGWTWRATGTIVTFLLVTLGWITFRTHTFAETGRVLQDLISLEPNLNFQIPLGWVALMSFVAVWTFVDRDRQVQEWLLGGFVRQVAAIAISLLALAVLSRADATIPFIYFRF